MSESTAYRVFISSGAFQTVSVSKIIESAMEGGIHCLELGSGTEWDANVLDAVRERFGRPMRYLVHNYFPPHERPFVLNLASTDEEILARSREHCRNALQLTAEFGAPFFSVHAGFAFSAKPEELGRDLSRVPRQSLTIAHDIFVESLKWLCMIAASLGVKVLVENNVIAPFNLIDGKNRLGLCATAEDLLRTHAEVNAPNLGFLVDVGHLKVTANALNFDKQEFLDQVQDKVAAFHLSDNDGSADQNLPFSEDAWFLPRLVEFPRAVMILEAYRLQLAQIRACCAVIESAL